MFAFIVQTSSSPFDIVLKHAVRGLGKLSRENAKIQVFQSKTRPRIISNVPPRFVRENVLQIDVSTIKEHIKSRNEHFLRPTRQIEFCELHTRHH